MAITFINTGAKSASTYRNKEQLSGKLALGVEPYKEDEVITNATLERPFRQLTAKVREIYSLLARSGVNAR